MKYYDAHKDQVLVSGFTLSILILLKQESSTIFPLPFLRISIAYRAESENENIKRGPVKTLRFIMRRFVEGLAWQLNGRK